MEPIEQAAARVRDARSLLVTAGAGMGVDSGLPDFRGPQGFWQAYPAYGELGLRFEELANPRWFASDPALAWGFYGHRLELYRRTKPHQGFAVLARWAAEREHFVFTSNVDGHFQRAGFELDRVAECHGALDFLQCTRGCPGIFPADPHRVDVDPTSFRASPPLPTCRCGALARPNVLMFGDWAWDSGRTDAQLARLERWLEHAPRPLVVVECGAGSAIPTVRSFGELRLREGASLVRLNPREPQGPSGTVSVALGARAALVAIDARLGG